MHSGKAGRSIRWRASARLLVTATVAVACVGFAAPGAQAATSLKSASTGDTVRSLLAQWGDKTADSKAKNSSGKNDASLDPGSLASITTAIGARSAWALKDARGKAITGAGVTVAVLDSGVDNSVTGLNAAGKVVYGPDLSMEANAPALRNEDTYGHGTFMAGIIAAKDTVTTDASGQPQPRSDATQLGVAPDAKLLAVKLGATDGSTDVSQVIAALDWVVQHKNDNGMNIRVVNLSYGTDSVQAYQRDPLTAAAENAWKHGIVVVASGGNEGTTTGSLTDPATDPYVIAVGASTANNDKSAWANPTPATFSQVGTAARHVDLVAPGTSLVSLRSAGSYIDVNHPEGLVAGDTTGRLFRGSGTSQAAAVVTGAAALLLQAFPALTPDEVKYALMTGTTSMSGGVITRGSGELYVPGALAVAGQITGVIAPALNSTQRAALKQTWANAAGTGSLDAARGGNYLIDPVTGAQLTGEKDIQGQPWNGAVWAKASTAGTAWTGGTWNGARWSGNAWANGTWSNDSWSGARWSGARWSDASWTGARWSGARWSGAAWQ